MNEGCILLLFMNDGEDVSNLSFQHDDLHDTTRRFDCTYMYMQLHVHVNAIARTCMCNQLHA